VTYRRSVPKLYELALKHESGTAVTSTGALVCKSGKHTGRCPQDKRIVKEPTSEKDVWWGPINFPLSDHSFMINRYRCTPSSSSSSSPSSLQSARALCYG
jgi:phosphoenolpyruvate carboxykinase (ATP)